MEALIGFGIAVVVGLTGMGGGPLAAPVLMLALGVPTAEAVGTSLLFVAFTKFCAATVYWKRGHINWPVLGRLLIGGMPGVLVGSFLLGRMTESPKLQPLVLASIGLLIAVLAAIALWKTFSKTADVVRAEKPQALPWIAFPIAMEVGFSSAGAGALTSLSLLRYTHLLPASVVGTDLAFGLSIAVLGGGFFLLNGTLNQHLLISLCTGGFFGALCGAWLGTRIPARFVRLALTGVMIFLGQQLLWRGVSALAR